MPSRFLAAAAAAALAACVIGVGAWSSLPFGSRAHRYADIVNATVRVEAGDSKGSGTVLRACETYRRCRIVVLTNHHVLEGKKSVTLRGWIRESGRTFPVVYEAKVTASDESRDLALLAIDGPDKWAGPVAVLAAASEKLIPGEEVLAAGSALGRRPHVTQGLLSLLDETLLERPHIITSAPIAPGNSGGSLSVRRGSRYFMIGVPRAVASIQIGFGGSLITTHGFVIPLSTVREFLHAQGLSAA